MFWGIIVRRCFFIVLELIMKEKVFVRGIDNKVKIYVFAFLQKLSSLSSSSGRRKERGESVSTKLQRSHFFENLKIFENTDRARIEL